MFLPISKDSKLTTGSSVSNAALPGLDPTVPSLDGPVDLTSGPGLEAGTFLSEYTARVVAKVERDWIAGEGRITVYAVRASIHGRWRVGGACACGRILIMVLWMGSDMLKISAVSKDLGTFRKYIVGSILRGGSVRWES
jgi:hypothetical protein